MAEIATGLVVNGVTEILKRLIPMATQEIGMVLGVNDDMRKLRDTLEMIVAVTVDAEERQVKERAVRVWLRRLKDAAYDADDVLDEFSYEAMRRDDQMRSLKDKVHNFASSSNRVAFPFKMAYKIKKINENLDAIAKNMNDFRFQRIPVTNIHQPNRKIEVSLVDESVIEGRANDKLALVNSLLKTNNVSSSSLSSSSIQNHYDDEKVSVISIVGMGGLGKTTLAKSVYNDVSVMKHFELKIWVCVADDDRPFDEFKILQDMMEQIENSIILNKEVLLRQVKEKLGGKKYLLVLDDLWNVDASKWDNFKIWLNLGAHGSKIIVTTRKNQVATTVKGMIPPYNLKELSEAHCWSIIKKKAFSAGGALETPNMINIGMGIAKKCCGLPLAATFLGCLMHSRREESEWRSIRDQNDIWDKAENENNIIPILKLSYDNLPSHLKQCFSYCCIFPKDCDINRETLIRLWMAEGFLQPSSGETEESMEDIGNKYFECLLSSSFFQDVKKNELDDIETFKMHDLVHDLAQNVVDKHECATLKVNGEEINVSEVRRLMLDFDERVWRKLPKALHNTKKLRTVVDFLSNGYVGDLKSFFSKKYLRVLHVHRVDSPIPRMKHLRYLDLSFSNIQSLSTICSFYNLQSLVLSGCKNVESLPSNIGSLKNLRYLDVSRTNIKVLPDSITSLCNLRTLKFDHCRFLKALPSDFGKLKHLISLDLCFSSIEVLPDSITSLCNLRTLKFDHCENLKELPSDFGKLKNLRSLNLEGTNIRVLPEFCTDNLTNLEFVDLGDKCELPKEIKNWTTLRHLTISAFNERDDEMPRGMEKLTSLKILNPYAVRMKKDETECCSTSNSGIEELRDLNFLEKLKIIHLENVRGPIDAERANLKGKLHIGKLELYWKASEDVDDDGRSDGDALVLEALQPHPNNLRELSIEGFMGSWFPMWMGGIGVSSSCLLINLVNLELWNCNRCEKLPALGQLPSLRTLWINGMNSIWRLGEELYGGGGGGGEFPSLINILLINMESLEEWVAPPPPPLS